MLTILLGTDWVRNREHIMHMVAGDVHQKRKNRILLVPELISHDTERRLCAFAGPSTSCFAEVLTFTQLCRRVSDYAECGMQPCLDNGGRVVAMASAARQLHSKLKAYASVETRPVFLDGLVNAIDEFKRCCITADDLMKASKQSGGAFAQKLEELALIMQTYDSICENGLRDPSSLMSWLLELLEECSYAQERVFYIDGFPDFTRQHMAIIEHLTTYSEHVVISLNCDSLDSVNPAFEKASETALALTRFAKNASITCEILTIDHRKDALQTVRNSLFRGSTTRVPALKNKLVTQQFKSIYDECLAAAGVINHYIQTGDRYRDFSVVCSDVQTYQNAINLVFERCGIPLYQSGTEDVLEHPIIAAILTAMDAATNGFEQHDVIRYMKSILSPIDLPTSDLVENYSIMWSISGNRWKENWTNNPDGLDAQWNDGNTNVLVLLNAARSKVVDPLVHLSNAFKNGKNVADLVDALFAFFDEIELAKKLENLSYEFEQDGDYRSAQVLDQIMECLTAALGQLKDVLGQTVWNHDAFDRLFRLLLSQYDIGTIPHVIDAVTMGPVSAMRCQQAKHLIVLGALEGQLPGYGGSTGVLSDHERVELRKLGVPLTGGAMDGVQAEFAEIYGVFCGAEETIHVFCPAGQPSFIHRRCSDFVDDSAQIDVAMVSAMADPMEAGAYLLRHGEESTATTLNLQPVYSSFKNKTAFELGKIDRDNIEKLYGKRLYLSASQVDKQANCRLSYFLRYGLNAKERKPITIDPAEFGTYVHAVLENTAKEIMALGGFKEVSLEQTMEIAKKHSDVYAQNRFSQIDSQRLRYLFNRNAEELYMVVQDLWQELHQSAFIPTGFEVAFGDGKELPSIPVSGTEMEARLRGFVDRVDVWQNHGNTYFRVVDYKTGRKDFDYCDIFNGYGLQMLLYLFALENSGETMLGLNPIPAGVQYFPARAPLVSAEGKISDEDAQNGRNKQLKRKGLLLHDDEVLAAMEPGDIPQKLCFTRKKDGTVSGDIASREQLKLLKSYVFQLLGELVDDIASGCIDANPYTRGSSHNACTYCPYATICHMAYVEGRRNYKTMTAQRFWEEIDKEVKSRGR